MSANPVCPVCEGLEFAFLRDAFDDRYGHPGQFSLQRCTGCGHVMTLPLLRERDLPELYGNYYPRKNISATDVANAATGVASPAAALGRWFAGTDNQGQYGVRPGERMLDLGCGSGLSLLEAHALGAQAWGVEADPNVRRIADALRLNVHQGSLHDMPFPGLLFDLVVLNQVIEHIPEPDKTLSLIASRLAPGGRVVLVFPNTRSLWCRLSGARWINWHIPYHLHHFDLNTFSRMARRCGYRTVRSRTVTPNIWTVLQLRAMRARTVPGQPSSLWAVEPTDGPAAATLPGVGAGSRKNVRRFALTCLLPIVAVFNRCVDALGWGDSLMVELRPVA